MRLSKNPNFGFSIVRVSSYVNTVHIHTLLAFSTYSTVSTVCVTCVWASVDSAWEQRNLKPRVREMLVNRAESPASSGRFVRWRFE